MMNNKNIKHIVDFAKSDGSAGVNHHLQNAHIPNFSKCNPYNYDKKKFEDLAKNIDHPSGKGLAMIMEIDDKAEVIDADFLNEPEIVDSINGELCCLNKLSFNMPVRKYDPIKHVIPNFSKALFMPDYFKKNIEQMLYDEKTLKPLNHLQYVVVSGQMAIAGGVETVFCHGYTLVEPVYLTRFKYTGTHSHTNLPSMTIQTVGNEDYTNYTVYKPQTNLFTILERELKIAGVKTDEEDSTWYSRIKIMDKELLKANGIGSNEVFTSATLHQVLIKIGTYLSRVPKLYFNPKYVYGSTDEDEREFLLYFEPKINRARKVRIEDILNEDAQILGYSESNTQSKNAGTVICECENVKTTNGVWYPAKGQFIAPTGDESEFEVKTSSNYSLKLPCAIEKVNTIKILKFDRTDPSPSKPFVYSTYFKEGKCLEFKEWLTLDEKERNKTPYFIEGTNEIQIKHCFSVGSNGWIIMESNSEYYFSINYVPRINAKLTSVVNNGYEECINQVDSVLDSKLIGDYIQDYSKANCNCDIYLIQMIADYKDILRSGTLIVDEENHKKYVVDKVNAIKCQSVYRVYYTMSIDTDKRSEIVGASNIKKIASIDADKAYSRLDDINERKIYCNLSLSEPLSGENSLNLKYIKKMEVLFENLIKNKEIYFPSIALCKLSYAKYKHVYDHGDSMSMTEKYPDPKYIWFSLNKTVCGTSLVYNISSLNNRNMQIGGGLMTWEDSSYNLFHRYTDEFGAIDKISIVLTSFSSEYIDAISSHDNGDGYQQLNVTSDEAFNLQKLSVSFNENFPLLTETSLYDEREKKAAIVINNYEVLKDTYEQLNITYQIPFAPADDDSVVNTYFAEMLSEIDFDGEKEYSIAVIDPSTSHYSLEREVSLSENDMEKKLEIAACGYLESQNAVEIQLSQSYEFLSGKIIALIKKSKETENVYDVLIASRCVGELAETDKVYLWLRTI